MSTSSTLPSPVSESEAASPAAMVLTPAPGWVLDTAIREALGAGMPLSFGGIEIDYGARGDIRSIKIGGDPIQAMRNYKVAVPEGIMRGALGLTRYLKIVFKSQIEIRNCLGLYSL